MTRLIPRDPANASGAGDERGPSVEFEFATLVLELGGVTDEEASLLLQILRRLEEVALSDGEAVAVSLALRICNIWRRGERTAVRANVLPLLTPRRPESASRE